MGRLVWTDPAIADLEYIMDHIARDSPQGNADPAQASASG